MFNQINMTKIQSNPHFDKEEERIFSILASIARLNSRTPFYRCIARYRRYRNPFRFHENNIKTVVVMSKYLVNGAGLTLFALDAQEILEDKKVELHLRD